MAVRETRAHLGFKLVPGPHLQTLELLQSIIDGLGDSAQPGPHPTDGKDEQIILDVELSGARYLLVRLPKPQHLPVLSPREQEIARMVGQGHSNKVIADVLNISSWTVCTHLRRIFLKLGVSSRAAMIARLFDHQGRADRVLLHSEARANGGEPIPEKETATVKPPKSALAGQHCVYTQRPSQPGEEPMIRTRVARSE